MDPAGGAEGDVFRFGSQVDNPSGSLLNYRWDFGDDTVVESVTNVSAYRHRFMDDGAFTVTLEVSLPSGETDSGSVNVTVDNVAPEVRKVSRSNDPVQGSDVTFTASVFDPGRDDLTFTWDFGDGSAPVTRRNARSATHVYEENGSYLLDLTVTDDEGDEASFQELVLVGEGFTFSASGAVSASEQVGSAPGLTGLPIAVRPDGRIAFRGDLGKVLRGENPAEGQGRCLVRMSSHGPTPPSSGLYLAFTAVLSGGLREGTFPVARQRNELPIPARSAFEEELESPGTFFAELTDIAGVNQAPSGTAFHGTGGTVTIHRYDGERVEATFNASLEERFGPLDTIGTAGGLAFPPPKFANVTGRFVHDLERTMFPDNTITFGDWYLCDSDEELEVVSHDLGADPGVVPAASGRPFLENLPWERKHYVSEEAKLEFTFDRPMLRSSLNDDTVVLEVYQTTYAGTGEPFMQVYGTVEAVDDETFTFVPDADLRDGVVYQMTLKPGRSGVRGRHGETLEEAYRWRFSTRVDVQNVEAHVYQVVRDTELVAGKHTLTRVYPFWRKHDDLPDESQVMSFPADISVEVDGVEVYPSKRGVYVTRPDLFDDADREAARNSVNFFGWRPDRQGGSSQLEVTLEPSYQPQSEPERVESEPLEVRHASRSPQLNFDYYFLTVRDWDDGVPPGFRATGHRLMQEGAQFTTQNLPVVGTVPRHRGDLDLPLPLVFFEDTYFEDGDCFVPYPELALEDPEAFPFSAGLDMHIAWELHRAARFSDADAVVGIVPPEIGNLCGWSGVMVSFPNNIAALSDESAENVHTDRVILMPASAPWYVLAHEFGHYFGLCHVPSDGGPGCVPRPQHHEGFRIAPDGSRGWNKSESEGNPESIGLLPLMNGAGAGMVDPFGPGAADLGLYFVTNEHYLRLIENVERVALSSAARSALAASGLDAHDGSDGSGERPRMQVTGIVAPQGDAGSLTSLRPARGSSTEAAGGPYRLSLLGSSGEVLASVGVNVRAPRATEGPSRDEVSLPFRGTLPFHEAGREIVLMRDGRALARRERSRHPPELVLEQAGSTVSWSAADADGDALRFDVSYSPDGRAWVPLAVGQRETSLVLPASLEPGDDPTVRVTASDGFDWTEARAPLDIDLPLEVLTTIPGDQEVLAPDGNSPFVFVNAELDRASVGKDAFTMEGPDGSAVAAAVTRVSGGRGLMLTPAEPLAPGTYRVRVSGLRAKSGAALVEPVAWTVTVEDEGEASGAADTTDAPTLPDACGPIARERILALLPEDHEVLSVAVAPSCTLEITVPLSVRRAQVALETSTLRNGYVPTRNEQREGARVFGFRDDALIGEAEISSVGGTTHLRLTLDAPGADGHRP